MAQLGKRGETRGRIFSYIRERILSDGGLPPSYDEIQADLGISSRATVFIHLVELEREGKIRRTPGAARSIFLTEAGTTGNGVEANLAEILRELQEARPDLARVQALVLQAAEALRAGRQPA